VPARLWSIRCAAIMRLFRPGKATLLARTKPLCGASNRLSLGAVAARDLCFGGHSMKMPRTTIRRLMAIVLLIAAFTWVGLAAERTRSNKARFHTHFHANGVPHDPYGEFSMTPEWVPFWPVYWRTLVGLPWDWRYDCVSRDGRREIACEHDFPRILVSDDRGKRTNVNFEVLQGVWNGGPLH
jgi:hypothetical protein